MLAVSIVGTMGMTIGPRNDSAAMGVSIAAVMVVSVAAEGVSARTVVVGELVVGVTVAPHDLAVAAVGVLSVDVTRGAVVTFVLEELFADHLVGRPDAAHGLTQVAVAQR